MTALDDRAISGGQRVLRDEAARCAEITLACALTYATESVGLPVA